MNFFIAASILLLSQIATAGQKTHALLDPVELHKALNAAGHPVMGISSSQGKGDIEADIEINFIDPECYKHDHEEIIKAVAAAYVDPLVVEAERKARLKALAAKMESNEITPDEKDELIKELARALAK